MSEKSKAPEIDSYGKIRDELHGYVVAGILACPCDNLKYANLPQATSAERIRYLAGSITISLAEEIMKKSVEDKKSLKIIGSCAQGLLASPHDNLEKALSEAKKMGGESHLFYCFSKACIDLAEILVIK
jgi:hypothetical protein